MRFLGLGETASDTRVTFTDRLAPSPSFQIASTIAEASNTGISISEILPLTPLYLEFGW